MAKCAVPHESPAHSAANSLPTNRSTLSVTKQAAAYGMLTILGYYGWSTCPRCSAAGSCGHIALAILPGLAGVGVGLVLVALGSGALKANGSSLLGTLYKKGDARCDGGFIGPLITGLLQTRAGFHYGFGAAAVGMALGLAQYVAFRRNLGTHGRTVANPLPRNAVGWAAVMEWAWHFFRHPRTTAVADRAVRHDKACARGISGADDGALLLLGRPRHLDVGSARPPLRSRWRVSTRSAWPTRYPAETEFAHNPVQDGNRIASLRV